MAEKIYPQGIMTFAKNANAPDFVLGNCVISLSKFKAWVNENQSLLTEYKGEKQLRLNITLSKDNRVTFTVDTWKKDDTISGNTPEEQEKMKVPDNKKSGKKENIRSMSDENQDLPF